jgi:hypothetical protein
MANFNLNLQTSVTFMNSTKLFKPTTSTPFIDPQFSGIPRVTGPYRSQNLSFSGLDSSNQILVPRRPGGGQLYPRGNQ